MNLDTCIYFVLEMILAYDFDPASDCKLDGPVCRFVHPSTPLPVNLSILLFDLLVDRASELIGGITVSSDAIRHPDCLTGPDCFLARALPLIRVVLMRIWV